MILTPPSSTLFPYTTLFRSLRVQAGDDVAPRALARDRHPDRRRHRGAREHRAARGDGEGPPHGVARGDRSEEHTSELQSRRDLVCRLLLEKKKKKTKVADLA